MSKADAGADMPNPEDQKINEEYKIWKKNTPFLYDTIMTHALEWPSLTCEWMPVSNEFKSDSVTYTEQKILLGTHTSEDEDNNLLIAKVCLPVEDFGKEGAADDATDGFGQQPPAAKIEIHQKIIHQGEVNRARYMPHNPFFVATKSAGPEVFIFDTSKHASDPGANKTFNPQIRCQGHDAESEGYGLAWSRKREGYLLSGSDDKNVCLWNIAAEGAAAELAPLSIFKGHSSVVEDVQFHCHDENVFGSVGDDRMLMLWDMRDPSKASHSIEAHKQFVNCLSFNPHEEHLLLTGSEDKTVAMWDMRKLEGKLHTFETHVDEVFCVEWAPFSSTVFASASSDRRVNIWDLKKIGAEQCEEDKEDGPPELLFIHGGHTSKISDISWNPNAADASQWYMASVAEDNVLQAWHMAENVYNEDEDGEAEVKAADLE